MGADTVIRPMNRIAPALTNVTQCTLDDIVRRIVEVAQPETIILFGSAARGEMGPHGDLDLLIIKSGADHWGLSRKIRRALRGVKAAVDLVIATPEDIERYKDSHALVYKPALQEGLVLHDAA